METIKRHSARWWPAVFAAMRYVLFQTLVAYHAWIISVKDSWDQLANWDKYNMACLVALAALGAIGAVMNGSWQKAANGDK